ncbi:hypothetical protein RFI_32189 [Reticulomyxa filosa]|uniref:RGS domain-containing protein n=1 Tax=Reticulomyxa filosa TaxID=46433 RepID=X6LWU0_RETFI|nr:hypothetical protein RFI_32189 [Reticulomyxa filosa]|eukprot:ETO05205.1 hypothetical protein RFI_32189 [Reticulomyxa filosa]
MFTFTICALISILLDIFVNKQAHAQFAALIDVLVMVLASYCWLTTPLITDAFGIRKECRQLVWLGGTAFVLFVFNNISLSVSKVYYYSIWQALLSRFWEQMHQIQKKMKKSANDDNIEVSKTGESGALKSLKIQTNVEHNATASAEIQLQHHSHNLTAHKIGEALARVFSLHSFTNVFLEDAPDSDPADPVQIIEHSPRHIICKQMFSHVDTVTIFGEYVQAEMCIENLIGFIEIYQFLKSNSVNESTLPERYQSFYKNTFSAITMSPDIPISLINQHKPRDIITYFGLNLGHENNQEEKKLERDDTIYEGFSLWMLKYMKIYEKYLDDHNAPFQLNLPHGLFGWSHHLAQQIVSKPYELSYQKDCEPVLIDVLKAVMTLLYGAVVRFKSSELFKTFEIVTKRLKNEKIKKSPTINSTDSHNSEKQTDHLLASDDMVNKSNTV